MNFNRLAMIFIPFFLTISHNTLANNECPDDVYDISKDEVTGCPTINVPAVMLPFPPYVITKQESGGVSVHGIAFDYIVHSFEGCCENSEAEVPTLEMLNGFNTDNDSNVFQEAFLNADVIFPVTESLETQLMFSGISYSFHDIVKSPGYVLIGRIDNYNRKIRSLVLDSLFDSWSIFALTFLLAGIAGIFIWALEFHVKNEDFPLSFARGSYEGFWWAFISMTTVGYGDKTPRSFIGRLFGVLWILVGLIVTTMFIATVTSALQHSSSPEFISALEGMDVGVLLRDSEAQAEASYLGAIPYVYRDIEDLDDALFDDDVEGIFMERLQAYYYFNDKVNDDNLRVFHAFHAEISYKMALKINTTRTFLKKNSCFRRRLEHPKIGSLIKRYTKPLKVFKPSVDTEGVLSGSAKHTEVLLLAILGVFLGLFILGVLVEFFVKKWGKWPCKPTLRDKRVSDASTLHVNITLGQLDSLEQNLEKLSSQVQTMKESLSRRNKQQPTENSLKLTEVHSSISCN